MKKKKILIFLFLLIVIFLMFYFTKQDNSAEIIINNTIEKLKTDEYDIKLTLTDTYLVDGREFSSKIVYDEIKKDNLYKFISNIYTNNSLTDKKTSYVSSNNGKYIYYYSNNDKYVKEEIYDITTKQDFVFDLKKFFIKNNKINKKNKSTYYIKLKNNESFALIYNNNNTKIKGSTKVIIKTKNDLIDSISFVIKDNNEEYNVKLEFDYSIQDITLPNSV